MIQKDITTTIELNEDLDVTQKMQFLSPEEGNALQISAYNTAINSFSDDVVVVMNSQKKGYWHQDERYDYYADPVDVSITCLMKIKV